MEKSPTQNEVNTPPEGYYERALGNGVVVWVDDDDNVFVPEGHELATISPANMSVAIDHQPKFKFSIEVEGYGHDNLKQSLRSLGSHAATQEVAQYFPTGPQEVYNPDERYAGLLDTPATKVESYTIAGNNAEVAPQSNADAIFSDANNEEQKRSSYERRRPRKGARRLAWWAVVATGGALIAGPSLQSGQAIAENCGLFVLCWPGHVADNFDAKHNYNIFNWSELEKK